MRANDEVTTLKTLSSFTNEPFTNFQFKENHQQMIDALAKVKSQCGRNAPLHIGDQKIVTTEKITSVNPADIDQVIGTVSKATTQHIEQAMEVATKTFEKWKKVSAEERASYLFKAAERMRERKHEFSALLILESGKNWAEADADTAEAIDFLEYYGRQMLRLDRINEISPLPQIPTEESFLRYIPLGVGVIIPPWNFPLAICVGMTSAAVVAGRGRGEGGGGGRGGGERGRREGRRGKEGGGGESKNEWDWSCRRSKCHYGNVRLIKPSPSIYANREEVIAMSQSVPGLVWTFYVIIPIVGMIVTIATTMFWNKKNQ